MSFQADIYLRHISVSIRFSNTYILTNKTVYSSHVLDSDLDKFNEISVHIFMY
jgi:hypothetical protein